MVDANDRLRQLTESKTLLTPRQQEIVQRSIKTLERALNQQAMPFEGGDAVAARYVPEGTVAREVHPFNVVNVPEPELLRRTLEEAKKTFQRGMAPPLSGAAKNTLYRWYKEDAEMYQEGMPSTDQMWRPTWQNLQQYMAHKAANRARAHRLQTIRRVLDPHDEMFHLEGFRPDKPTPFNLKAFGAGFDQVQWTEEQELQLRMQELDDETYYQFLQLKARGVDTPKLLQRQLGIDQGVYDACMARLATVTVALGTAETAEPLAPTVTAPSSAGQDALRKYGDAMLEALQAHPQPTMQTVREVLRTLDPQGFRGRAGNFHVSNMARVLVKALKALGHVQEEGDILTVVDTLSTAE